MYKNIILLVDDNPMNLKTLANTLEKQDYELLIATSGERGIKIAKNATPDLVLLDIRMPGLDGFEVCIKLKEIEITKDIPVIFLTALSEVENKVKAFGVGGVDYITKPFQQEEVLARVKSHLKISRLTRELAESLVKQQELSERLRKLSIQDPLTNLYNRRYFFESMEKEIKKAMRREEQMAIAIFDIDFFKSVNDTYGHLCGDLILKELGSIISQNIRETDLFARYGGEEFVAGFFDIESDGIYGRLEDIRKMIESHPFVFDGAQIKKTVSIGLTVHKFNRYSNVKVDNLVNEADNALYQAKETGRNKVVCFAHLAK